MSDVVLLPGFPLTPRVWAAQREALAAAGHRVLVPDLRGVGDGVQPSLDVVADDVVRRLDAEGLDRVALGGLSMGGYVAMAILRRHPDRIASLALVDTKASADAAAARDNRERIARTVLAERSVRVLIDDVLPTLLGATTVAERPAVVAAARAMAEAWQPESVAWSQRAMAARPDSTAVLRSAHVPALVVVGEEDQLSPVDDARRMVDALPRARLVAVPRAGHLSPLEAPAEVTAALVEFLVGAAAGRL
ncbi:MAG TPA: alpha/beta hydrolase [Mycobacteriales bacterium]|nr:alpha/beta hydrolase [Mycobacteriales bacterium]